MLDSMRNWTHTHTHRHSPQNWMDVSKTLIREEKNIMFFSAHAAHPQDVFRINVYL